jgi:hypothetical protein
VIVCSPNFGFIAEQTDARIGREGGSRSSVYPVARPLARGVRGLLSKPPKTEGERQEDWNAVAPVAGENELLLTYTIARFLRLKTRSKFAAIFYFSLHRNLTLPPIEGLNSATRFRFNRHRCRSSLMSGARSVSGLLASCGSWHRGDVLVVVLTTLSSPSTP